MFEYVCLMLLFTLECMGIIITKHDDDDDNDDDDDDDDDDDGDNETWCW